MYQSSGSSADFNNRHNRTIRISERISCERRVLCGEERNLAGHAKVLAVLDQNTSFELQSHPSEL